jgi:hypothetical protein
MTDPQKQILYNKYLHGDIKLEDILPGDLKALTKLWNGPQYQTQPSMDDQNLFRDELRRREVEAASKKMKPIDRDFFKDDKE